MEQTKLVPKRRFKEFQNTSAWEQRRLGDYTKLITKGTTPRNKSRNGEVNFVKVENIINGKILPVAKITEEEHENYLKRSKLEEQDILFSIAGTLGRTAVVNKSILPANTNQALAIIRGYEFDTDFLITSLGGQVVEEYIRKNPTVGAQPNFSLEQVRKLIVWTPCRDEQAKIGSFFKNLDNLITLHQRKLEKMKALKFAYLSEMFPAEGERLPKRRFAGFTQAWEQRKLKDFGKATGGTSIESEFVDGGKYKVISIGSYSEQSVYTDQNIRAELTDKTKNRILNKDDLTMILNDKTASGNIIGRVLLIDSNDSYVYNQRTERIEPDHEKYNSQFLYQLLNAPMIRSRIIKQAQGNTQIYVNWSAISELDYLVPNLDEQREIGAFFSNFDHLITLHQRKLEKLQNIKKAYLNEMFV
jgi:type I restriction enzyme S subunit